MTAIIRPISDPLHAAPPEPPPEETGRGRRKEWDSNKLETVTTNSKQLFYKATELRSLEAAIILRWFAGFLQESTMYILVPNLVG